MPVSYMTTTLVVCLSGGLASGLVPGGRVAFASIPSKKSTSLTPLKATVEKPVIEAIGMNPLEPDNYIALGLASVFVRVEQGVDEVFLIEPLTAGTLETLDLGVPTSYRRVAAYRCGDVFIGDDLDAPSGIKMEALANLIEGYESARLCEDVIERSLAAARTLRRRPEAQVVDLDSFREDFNFSVERKRIINEVFEPSFDDNVKQDASIDVYGRGGAKSADVDEAALADEIERLANS